MPPAVIVTSSLAGSLDGQCGVAASVDGTRQLASHHVRAGAAMPTSSATMTIDSRFTNSV
jgi:hypothetical protein